jgi:hypothetical protein
MAPSNQALPPQLAQIRMRPSGKQRTATPTKPKQMPLPTNPNQAEKQEFAAVGGIVLRFGLALLVGLWALLAPLPWPVVGFAAVVIGMIIGIRGIRRAKRLPGGGGAVVSLTIGLVLGGLLLLYSLGLVVTWPAQMNLHQCQQQALTTQAHDACQQRFEKETNLILMGRR